MILLTLVAVIVFSSDLFGLDLAHHRLHKVAWVVCLDDFLLSRRDHFTYSETKEENVSETEPGRAF